mgnify:FL=1
MLLNHKDALDFVLDVPDYLKELSVHRIEDIHSILTKELEVDRNIRHRRVGITGTNYRTLDISAIIVYSSFCGWEQADCKNHKQCYLNSKWLLPDFFPNR